MNKSVAIFYSENADCVLASKVKETLNKFKIYTIYLKDINDILLKKFSDVDFLILDYVKNQLDDKSEELLKRLYEEEYIKRLLVVKDKDNFNKYEYPSIKFTTEDFSVNLLTKIQKILSTPMLEKKITDSHWVKIIGNFLSGIGFSLRQSGYFMLIDALVYIMSNKGIIGKMNDDLYAYLAIKYDKKISCVEMNIRKSIKIAFERSRNFPFEYCPTNKEFITFAVRELFDKIYIKNVI